MRRDARRDRSAASGLLRAIDHRPAFFPAGLDEALSRQMSLQRRRQPGLHGAKHSPGLTPANASLVATDSSARHVADDRVRGIGIASPLQAEQSLVAEALVPR